MSTSPAAFVEELNALRRAYARELPKKIQALESALQAVFATPAEEAPRTHLNRLLHTLVGSSGTLGFSGVCFCASSLKALIRSAGTDGTAGGEPVRSQAAAHLIRMKRAAQGPDQNVESTLPFEPDAHAAPPENRLIFLVEDDAQQAGTLAAQLRHFAYEVRSFPGIEGLTRALAESTPAAIIVDIILPEGDLAGARGIASLRSLRRLPIPVLFLTVRSDLAARIEAVRAGADAYFTKPGDLGALIDRLDLLTARRVPEPYRVLIVDDDRVVAEYNASALRRAGMIVEIVNDPLQAMAPLLELSPDLLLLDCNMPGASGPELAAAIRQQVEMVGVPIVFLSSETELEKQLAARKVGAEDFLTKPVTADRLITEVTLRVDRARILRSHMVRDGHTGLLNHSAFVSQLQAEVERARRRGSALTFAMIDIDRFKLVNDTYGHRAGDRAIRSLARLLQKRLRKTDVIGRTEGDQFAVALLDTNAETGARVIEEIRASFAQISHPVPGGSFEATFSAGVASFPQFPVAGLLGEAADKALARAKREGRNRIAMFQG